MYQYGSDAEEKGNTSACHAKSYIFLNSNVCSTVSHYSHAHYQTTSLTIASSPAMSPFLKTLSPRRILIPRSNSFLQHTLLLIYSTGVGWATIVRQKTRTACILKYQVRIGSSPELAANFSSVSRSWTCGLPLLDGHQNQFTTGQQLPGR